MGLAIFIVGIFASLLPPRYRDRLSFDITTAAFVTSGLLQATLGIVILLIRFIDFGQSGNEIARVLLEAADKKAATVKDSTSVPKVELPTPAVGILMMTEFITKPLNMYLFYNFFEGMVRALAAVTVGEKIGHIPLYPISGVQRLWDKAKHKRDLGPLVMDEVLRGTPKSDYDLKVYSCRPKLDWNTYITIEFEEEFYQLTREEPAPSPRRFVYYLRKNPTGRIVVQVRHYKIDDVLKG